MSRSRKLYTTGRNNFKRKPALERVYGWFRCGDCRKTWESAYVWNVKGTNKVYYKQDCKKCGCSKFPYKTEQIVCQVCHQKPCECDNKRHSDPLKNHIQKLCHKCKNKSQPCSSSS
mmetsp:Transcript_53989/g.89432  ORF Transcript_53989/g.89432 Transcript_53989/m.89432 type:complete len:116 (-) Transcript_53989:151-498(-)